ncbi:MULTISPECIES: endonuclease/exonuclease/phosphatase family protein [unclassified Streptomyces]|uniref:endonuclease/exonuclease/phosphatase family protein n=1 Tax=unclassified Streptomyces TaxID=2593676 RepID=UPI0036EE122B
MALGKGTRLVAGAAIVACVALAGRSATGDATPGGSLPPEAVKDVVANRVMTWNLCNPCDASNADQAAEIAAYAPQVVAVQEACVGDVEKIRDDLERLHGLVYHVEYGAVLRNWGRCGGVPWSPGGYGQALLSASPMTDRVLEEYPDGGSEDRGYLAVTTKVGGETVRVFNTHLAERRQEEVRAEQADVLAKKVGTYDRAIVLGDFNAVPYASELSPMWALATDTDPQCDPSSAGACRTTTDWQSKFDYVFLRGITPLQHHVRPSEYSDHHLVYADLNLG